MLASLSGIFKFECKILSHAFQKMEEIVEFTLPWHISRSWAVHPPTVLVKKSALPQSSPFCPAMSLNNVCTISLKCRNLKKMKIAKDFCSTPAVSICKMQFMRFARTNVLCTFQLKKQTKRRQKTIASGYVLHCPLEGPGVVLLSVALMVQLSSASSPGFFHSPAARHLRVCCPQEPLGMSVLSLQRETT